MLRELEERDLPIIVKMDVACFPANQRLSIEEYQEALIKGKGWVFETKNENKIAGFLVAAMEGMPYIFSVAVLPEYRGRFIATRLIQQFLKEYSKYSFTHLHTDNQSPAQMLYFRQGFRVVDVEDDYYGEQTVGLHMVRYKV